MEYLLLSDVVVFYYDSNSQQHASSGHFARVPEDWSCRCSLCKSEFDRATLTKHMREELENLKTSQAFRRTQKKMTQLDQAIGGLQSIVPRFQAIDKEFSNIKEAIETYCHKHDTATLVSIEDRLFNLDLEALTNQMRLLQERLEGRKTKLEEQEQSINKKKDLMLFEIVQNIDILHLVIDFMEKRDQMSGLKNIFPDAFRQKEKLERKLDKVYRYSSKLKLLCECLDKSRTKAASEILDALKPQMNLLYKRLRPHPVYDTINIEVKRGKGRLGKRLYSYMITAISRDKEKRTYVKTRFSQAQMNVSGLSIFLALVLGAPHKFETIILDEPDQSLDLDHKESLAAVLRDLQNYKQIIAATQDEDFQKVLLERLVPSSGKSRAVYDFHDWESEHGSSITRSIHKAQRI